MKSYRELMGEMVVLDLPKARKNKIFKKEGEEKKIEHLISRLMLSNFVNLKWLYFQKKILTQRFTEKII